MDYLLVAKICDVIDVTAKFPAEGREDDPKAIQVAKDFLAPFASQLNDEAVLSADGEMVCKIWADPVDDRLFVATQ